MTTLQYNNKVAIIIITCYDIVLLIGQNTTEDIFNPFVMDLTLNIPPRTASVGDGNETIQNLNTYPIVTLTGPTQIEVILNIYTHTSLISTSDSIPI